MVLDFSRSDRIALRDAQAEQERATQERETALAVRMRRAAARRDALTDLRVISTPRPSPNEIPDEVA